MIHQVENAAEFHDHAVEGSRAEPVIAIFTASWCGPCKSLKPKMEVLAQRLGFKLVAVDAGNNRELAAAYGVRSVPSMRALHAGVVVNELSGDHAESVLTAWLKGSGISEE